MSAAAPSSSASVRRSVTAGAALISTVGMLVLIAVVILIAWRTTDQEMDVVLATRIAEVRDAITIEAGQPVVDDSDEAAFDTSSWVSDNSGRLIAGPRVPAELTSVVTRFGLRGHGPVDVDEWRVSAAPLVPDSRSGRAIVAIDTDPYRTGLARLAIASGATGVVVVVGVALLAGLIVRRALAPVAEMTATADAWSHERLDRRFDLGRPKDEITGLAAVLDGLLERVDRAIRAEQRLTAELAHELRTPLTVIRGEAELGAAAPRVRHVDRERFERIVASADDMGSAMTTLLDAARGVGSAATVDVATALAVQAARPGLALPVEVGSVPPGLTAAAPIDLLGRAIGPLIDNAARHGRTVVRIGAQRRDSTVVIRVEDDGPGLAQLAGDVFEPGVRDADSEGAGLGLALARRLARSAGGDAVLVTRTPAVFAIEVPEAPEADPVARR